jgi:hypothetical protein
MPASRWPAMVYAPFACAARPPTSAVFAHATHGFALDSSRAHQTALFAPGVLSVRRKTAMKERPVA